VRREKDYLSAAIDVKREKRTIDLSLPLTEFGTLRARPLVWRKQRRSVIAQGVGERRRRETKGWKK